MRASSSEGSYPSILTSPLEELDRAHLPKLKPSEEMEKGDEEKFLELLPGHPTWSDSISMGLVNIPIRTIPNTLERKMHQK